MDRLLDDEKQAEAAAEQAQRRKKKLTPVEFYTLSPWRKFYLHGVIPWSTLCHVILVILVTTQIIVRNGIWAPYSSGSTANFCHFFFG